MLAPNEARSERIPLEQWVGRQLGEISRLAAEARHVRPELRVPILEEIERIADMSARDYQRHWSSRTDG